jgi:hypothetical protein
MQARRLISQSAVSALAPHEVEQLQRLLDGPHPWQDLKEIQQLRSRLAAIVQSRLEELHSLLDRRVADMGDHIKATAERLGRGSTQLATALADAQSLRCTNCVVGRSGACKTCRGGLTELNDRIDAIDARLAKILAELAVPERSPEERRGEPKLNSSLSLREVMTLPRVIVSREDVDSLVRDLTLDLKTALEKIVDEYGSATLLP